MTESGDVGGLSGTLKIMKDRLVTADLKSLRRAAVKTLELGMPELHEEVCYFFTERCPVFHHVAFLFSFRYMKTIHYYYRLSRRSSYSRQIFRNTLQIH